jgi:hypothetical protein
MPLEGEGKGGGEYANLFIWFVLEPGEMDSFIEKGQNHDFPREAGFFAGFPFFEQFFPTPEKTKNAAVRKPSNQIGRWHSPA